MNGNGNAADFHGATAAPRGCERAEEFVTYLYGEAAPGESAAFSRHLEACAVCRDELAALGGVREAVGVWRAEALGSVPSLDLGAALAPSVASRPAFGRKRSAAAAFREFFSLAPLWLRAGAFAATLALCALSALALARAEVSWDAGGLAFRTGAGERVIKEQAHAPSQPAEAPSARNLYTEEQVKAIVARNVAEATARLKEGQRQPENIVTAAGDGAKPRPRAAGSDSQRRGRPTRTGARRDDPLLAEDNLPRLSDLLDGSYED